MKMSQIFISWDNTQTTGSKGVEVCGKSEQDSLVHCTGNEVFLSSFFC